VVEADVSKIFVDSAVGLNFGGEWRKTFSANTKSGRKVNPTPADPALLTHFQNVLSKLQPAVIKRPMITPEPARYMPPSLTSMQTSYATRAAAATFTSSTNTTYNTNRETRSAPSHRQTHTESVVVLEQYEERFVHVESRLTMVERTVNKSGNMLAKLLRHNGIDIEDDENLDPLGAPMEIEHHPTMANGTKRICPTTNHSELSPHATPNSHHA
jgi:hypothetical protein